MKVTISKELYLKLVDNIVAQMENKFDRVGEESEDFKTLDNILKKAYEETNILPKTLLVYWTL